MIPGAKTWTLAITACLMLPSGAARAEFRPAQSAADAALDAATGCSTPVAFFESA